MAVKWVSGSQQEFWIGIIGCGLRINLERGNDGCWGVTVGTNVSPKRPQHLLAAQTEGIRLAREVLTFCLICLDEGSE